MPRSHDDAITPEPLEGEISRLVAALGDPTRRSAFFHVRASTEPQSKDHVAAALGIDRRLAGFHLDKLVDQGFLRAEFRRRTGRTGPGAGRPAKLYSTAETEVHVDLPERRYDVLASLLLKVAADESGAPTSEVIERVGFEFGLQVGLAEAAAGARSPSEAAQTAAREVAGILSRLGFAATTDGGGGITACACPFEDLAFRDPERICGLDRAIWRGILAAFVPTARLTTTTTRALGDDACAASVHEPRAHERGAHVASAR